MASFMDLMSSPDPLVDDTPSSMRPVTRRMARNFQAQQRYSSLSAPASTPARALSTGKSPRKQTFELDVGDEHSPQKILVTVEADDDRGRNSSINRRLFPTSSPTRSVSRRRETATTTIVPLRGMTDDEGGDFGDAPTPRRRGRPPGSKNGTPNPRGKKRAGTPLRKTPRSTRLRSDADSDASLFSEAVTETDVNTAGDATPKPKPKPRARKTPKKTGTPAASSSKPTGRKRGRPRKELLPEELAVLTDAASEAESQAADMDMQPNEDAPISEDAPPEARIGMTRNQADPDYETAPDDGLPPISSPQQNTIRRVFGRTTRQQSIEANQAFEPIDASTHEARVDEFDAVMTDDYIGEPHSDLESEDDNLHGGAYGEQDNLTHASDFSMIAVDTLPSFQSSLKGNQSGISEQLQEFEDAGDETNMMINQTMESLRRSTQSESHGGLDIEQRGETEGEEVQPKHSSAAPLQSSPGSFRPHPETWSRSPRRQKHLPLSRQIFSGKAPHVDDSFSSIPGSVLEAATPGRLPMKATTANEDASMYDDSFSEIPEEVLQAATPKPPSRTTGLMDEEADSSPASEEEIPSATRSTNIGSSRLPTPDDTNSSTTGSKNAQDEDTQRIAAEASTAPNTSDPNIRSSPPAIGRQLTVNIDSEISQLEQTGAGTPAPHTSSSQLSSTHSVSPEHSKALESSASNRRPTLSPIVRVGRTLQSIMSDRSSPEGRESSLGSPFRGSVQNDSRQSSVQKSPVGDTHNSSHQSMIQPLFNPIASLAQSIRSGFGQSQTKRQDQVTTVVGNVEDPFGPDMHDYSQTESLRRSAYGANSKEDATQPIQPNFFPSVTSSTRAAPPSDDEMSWVAEESSPATQRSRRLSTTQRFGSTNSSLFGTRGSNGGRMMDMDDVGDDAQEEREDEQDEEDDHQPGKELEQELVHGSHEEEDGAHGEGADMWDIEASRPTPRSTKVLRAEAQERRGPQSQAPAPSPAPAPTNSDPPRRSKIPSPWRRTSRRLIYQDEFKSPSQIEVDDSPPSEGEAEEFSLNTQRAALQERVRENSLDNFQEQSRVQPQELSQEKPADNPVQPVEPEDYSMVAPQGKNAAPVQEKPSPAKKGFFGGFDIMSFFSSPAPLPKSNPLQMQTQTNKTPVAERNLRQPPSAQSVDQPLREEPQSALRATGLFPPIPQKVFLPSPERRVNLFSPGAALKSTDTVADTYDTSPSTPERQVFPSIVQKRNFTPLSGQSRNTASLFTPSRQGSTPGSARDVRTPSPDRDHLQVPYEDEEGSSLVTEESEFERIPPREKPSIWDKTLSPTKSSFRSPLKPRTPGRVIKFSGINLEPQTYTQAGADRQRALGTGSGGNIVSQAPLLAVVPEDKENTPSPPKSPDHTSTTHIAHVQSPFAASAKQPASSATSSLSQTTWTKPHWLRLDELLQLRRRDPFQFQLQHPLPPSSSRKHVNGHHPLVGKEVSAGEEKMILQGWHLEIVEAFHFEVGGWDDKALAKRLFALIVGEERRRLGKIKKGGRGKVVA